VEALAESKAGRERHQHGDDHRHQAEHDRALEGAGEVADHLLLEQVAEPVERQPAHRERQAARRPLEGQDGDGDRGTIEEQHEQDEEARQQPEGGTAALHR
jgi:hypothetical protein